VNVRETSLRSNIIGQTFDTRTKRINKTWVELHCVRHPRKELAALVHKPGRAKALRWQLRMLEKQALISSSFAMQIGATKFGCPSKMLLDARR
jgi:hypothetical protein